jgi:hypothetical protein
VVPPDGLFSASGAFTADPDLCLQIGLALQIIRIREVLHDVPDQLPTRSP